MTSIGGTGADISATPAWFPHLIDRLHDRALLVAKSEQDYREASFLDDRSLKPDQPRQVIEWRQLAAALPGGARRDAQYIFHIGHVGSTLISRLLGELESVLAIREPAILRSFAEALGEREQAEALWDPATLPGRIDTLTALLSRTFRPGQRAMVKATSFASEIAGEIVPPGSGALLLYSPAERYIENIVAGDNSRQELNMTAQARLKRLHGRSGGARWRLWEMAEGERIAMAWACEMTSLAQAAADLPAEAVMWMDFDVFLHEPVQALAALAAFFGHKLDAEGAGRLAGHPLMGRYSKAPEYEYTPRLRKEVLAQARREHGPAIASAMRWLETAARGSPAVAAALERG